MRAKIFLSCAGIVLALNVPAKDLESQIETFIKAQVSARSLVEVKVKVTTPASQWPQCEFPQLSLPNSMHRWGKISLSARCGQERRFIQAEVAVTGQYLAASRKISAGNKLTATDITVKTGRLDTLPSRTLTDINKAIGAISLREIPPNQPLNSTMLRRAWVVKAGQFVQILTEGNGFSVRARGRAMNNAAEGEQVRVRMTSGQIVSGIAGAGGEIHIML